MATPLYDALVTKVRSWVNRDSNVLTDALIGDFLDYSADYCYRTVKFPPFEETFDYAAITAGDVGETSIALPSDFSELIQLSKTDSAGNTIVFEERLSLAALEDKDYTLTGEVFARKGNNYVFYPAAEEGDVFQLHYFKRLADLNATYAVNQINYDAGLTEAAEASDTGAVEFPADSGSYRTGTEVPNWLRDSNERTLLWGAVAHSLDYVGEDERAAKFFAKQLEAIAELNKEEANRRVRGASLTASYSNVADL